jgi:hypothetical protein
MYFDYHPVVVHDLHEAISLLLTWNGTGPYNPHMDAIVASRWLEMSFHEVSTLSSMGMPGVWTWNFGEGFASISIRLPSTTMPSGGRNSAIPHKTVGAMPTRTVEPRMVPAGPPDPTLSGRCRQREFGRRRPCDTGPSRGVRRYRSSTRYNSWRKGIDENLSLCHSQHSLTACGWQMVNCVTSTPKGAVAGRCHAGRKLPGRDYLVRLDQPYRNFALDVLQAQHFPEDSGQLPYDDVSWAYPVGFDVRAVRIEDERVKRVDAALLTENAGATGSVSGEGPVDCCATRARKFCSPPASAWHTVEIMNAAFTLGKIDYPPGSWIVSAVKDSITANCTAIEAVSQSLG